MSGCSCPNLPPPKKFMENPPPSPNNNNNNKLSPSPHKRAKHLPSTPSQIPTTKFIFTTHSSHPDGERQWKYRGSKAYSGHLHTFIASKVRKNILNFSQLISMISSLPLNIPPIWHGHLLPPNIMAPFKILNSILKKRHLNFLQHTPTS